MSSDVNLASQTHQVPHIGLPHTAPVTKARNVNKAPILAEEIAIISKTLILHINDIIAEKKRIEYAKRDSHALGT